MLALEPNGRQGSQITGYNHPEGVRRCCGKVTRGVKVVAICSTSAAALIASVPRSKRSESLRYLETLWTHFAGMTSIIESRAKQWQNIPQPTIIRRSSCTLILLASSPENAAAHSICIFPSAHASSM
jgi:hypothetical protein